VGFKASQDIYMSRGSGKVSWKYVPCYKLTATGELKDFVVEDEDVAYALDANGVSKTTNSGASWGTRKPMDGISGYMITLAPNGDILVGGSDGKVAWSTDGGSTFTASQDMVGGVSGNVHVVADPDYENNSTIYCANNAESPDQVRRAKTDKTTTFSGRGPTIDSTQDVTGMTEANGLIYVMTANITHSKLWRNMTSNTPLATADTAALALWSGRSAANQYLAAPKSIVVSDGPKFWAVDTVGANDLDSFSDPLAVNAPTLNTPASGAAIPVNPETGRAYTITFGMDRYHNKYATGLQMQIATDSDFTGVVTDLDSITVDKDTISVTVGPNAAYPSEYMPGYTYYWRVRNNDASGDYMLSPWSEVRDFTVEELGILPTELQSPMPGATGTSLTPAFSWTSTVGAIAYEFEIAKDEAFTVPGWKRAGSSGSLPNPAYVAEHELELSTTYFWRARPVFSFKPASYGDWATSTFTTMGEAPPPPPEKYTCAQCGLVFESQEALAEHFAKYHPPAAAPPPAVPTWALIAIIAIGAVLFIALIVLIVRTRRVV
jgi:hypothetical protein